MLAAAMSDQSEYAAVLSRFEQRHDYFVGIDSDGCVFNSMEVKHNDCFSVAVVREFELAAVSRDVHEVWDFVNLYSQTRGCNRFVALSKAFELLRTRPRVQQSPVDVPALEHLDDWIKNETTLGNATLELEIGRSKGERLEELTRVLKWSQLVNQLVRKTVKHLPPFAGVEPCLERFRQSADAMVVSSTPVEALEFEWAQHRIDRFVSLIAGQEMGPKSQQLAVTTRGRYAPERMLMIGDAPGDLKAARSVGALFYPITPGDEESSWKRLLDEGIDRFFSERYSGNYQDALVTDFMQRLPEQPSW